MSPDSRSESGSFVKDFVANFLMQYVHDETKCINLISMETAAGGFGESNS